MKPGGVGREESSTYCPIFTKGAVCLSKAGLLKVTGHWVTAPRMTHSVFLPGHLGEPAWPDRLQHLQGATGWYRERRAVQHPGEPEEWAVMGQGWGELRTWRWST